MRTIRETMLERMAAQAQEAEIQGLNSVAESLTKQIEKYAGNIRKDSEFYVYSSEDFKNDIKENVWDIIVRASDFYDAKFDADKIQKIAEKYVDELIKEVCVTSGISHGVGAYEPTVPGEAREKVELEVE